MNLRTRIGKLVKTAARGDEAGAGVVVYLPWKRPAPGAGDYPAADPPGVYPLPGTAAVLVVYDPDRPGTAPGERDYRHGG